MQPSIKRRPGRPPCEGGVPLSDRIFSVRLSKDADDRIRAIPAQQRAKIARDAIVTALNNYVDKTSESC